MSGWPPGPPLPGGCGSRYAPVGRREYIPVGSIAASLRQTPPGTYPPPLHRPGAGRSGSPWLRHPLGLLLLLLALFAGLSGWGNASSPNATDSRDAPIVRVQITPSGTVELGTELELQVDVLVPTWFLAAPRFPESIELPGATAELVRGSAENLSEAIADSTWAGLRRRYRIQPLNPGELRLPELAIPIRYAGPEDRKAIDLTVRGRLRAPVRVTVPAAAAGLDPFVAAHRLSLLERIERPQGALGVGDALRRTIVLETDAANAGLPSAIWVQGPGLRLYLDPPRSREIRSDAASRPLLRYERSATWVFEQPGSHELPAVRIAWWDLETRTLRQAELPAVRLDVGLQHSAPVFALPVAMESLTPDGHPLWALLRRVAPVLALALPCWLLWHWRHSVRRLLARVPVRVQAAPAAEWWLFRRAIHACRRDDGPGARGALQRWLDDCAAPAPGLNDWLLARAPSPALATALAELDAALYGADAAPRWHGSTLARQLIRARRRLARQRPPKAVTLPPMLNP